MKIDRLRREYYAPSIVGARLWGRSWLLDLKLEQVLGFRGCSVGEEYNASSKGLERITLAHCACKIW